MRVLTNVNLNQNELQNARIENLPGAPERPVEGQIYHNSADHIMYRYDGTRWIPWNTEAILSGTTAAWNSDPTLIAQRNTIYIYTDHEVIDDGSGNITTIPGIKVGDGLAYLIDIPFSDQLMIDHINDMNIHVTLAEKVFWNNKNRAFAVDSEETLILTTL